MSSTSKLSVDLHDCDCSNDLESVSVNLPQSPNPVMTLRSSSGSSSLLSKFSSLVSHFSSSVVPSNILGQCSFCTCELYEGKCNESTGLNENLREKDHLLPCGHLLCCHCMKESLNEIGISPSAIEQIILSTTETKEDEFKDRTVYQCPVCHVELLIVLPSSKLMVRAAENSRLSMPQDSTLPKNTLYSVHGENIKWYCSTCSQVACDECLSHGLHRSHQFSLCRTAAESLRSDMKDLLDRIRVQCEHTSTATNFLRLRSQDASYVRPREQIANHCRQLRTAIDELESKLQQDVDYFLHRITTGELERLVQEQVILENIVSECANYETLQDAELCLTACSIPTHENTLKSFQQTRSPDEELGLKLELGSHVLDMIKTSGITFLKRQPCAEEDRYGRLFHECCCSRDKSFEELKECSKMGNLVCLGYLCLLNCSINCQYGNVDDGRTLASQLFAILWSKCQQEDGRTQYLSLNKHELFILASMLCQGYGCQKNLVESFNCFRLSSMEDFPPSICSLGICYANGIGVSQNYQEAYKLYHKAALLGDAIAQHNVGYFLRHGLGTSSNYFLGLYFHYLSTRQGYRRSLYYLLAVTSFLSALFFAILWILFVFLFIV